MYSFRPLSPAILADGLRSLPFAEQLLLAVALLACVVLLAHTRRGTR